MYRVETPTRGRFFLMPHPQGAEAISALSQRGVQSIVSLLETGEAKALGLGEEGRICAALALGFHAMPIADFTLPDPVRFFELIGRISKELEAGKTVAVHCRAGIGRSGMVACGVLMHFGATSSEALMQVTQARGIEVPDTAEQRAFVEAFDPRDQG